MSQNANIFTVPDRALQAYGDVLRALNPLEQELLLGWIAATSRRGFVEAITDSAGIPGALTETGQFVCDVYSMKHIGLLDEAGADSALRARGLDLMFRAVIVKAHRLLNAAFWIQ